MSLKPPLEEPPLYDVPAECRNCGALFTTKSFVQRTADHDPVPGLCDACYAIEFPPKLPHPGAGPRRVFGEHD